MLVHLTYYRGGEEATLGWGGGGENCMLPYVALQIEAIVDFRHPCVLY